MQEHITGMMVDQVFNREQQSFDAFEAINALAPGREHQVDLLLRAFYPGVDLIGAIAVGMIIWYAGVESLGGTSHDRDGDGVPAVQ